MRIARMMTGCAFAVAWATLVLGGWGCSRQFDTRESVARPVSLVVTNNGFYDVNVYTVPDGAANSVRLATVYGMSSQTLAVRERHLQTGQRLVLQLHAIGTSADWLSPSLMVDERSVALLDIYTAPSGDMRMSAFYLRANR